MPDVSCLMPDVRTKQEALAAAEAKLAAANAAEAERKLKAEQEAKAKADAEAAAKLKADAEAAAKAEKEAKLKQEQEAKAKAAADAAAAKTEVLNCCLSENYFFNHHLNNKKPDFLLVVCARVLLCVHKTKQCKNISVLTHHLPYFFSRTLICTRTIRRRPQPRQPPPPPPRCSKRRRRPRRPPRLRCAPLCQILSLIHSPSIHFPDQNKPFWNVDPVFHCKPNKQQVTSDLFVFTNVFFTSFALFV